jgi:hypothetical protein
MMIIHKLGFVFLLCLGDYDIGTPVCEEQDSTIVGVRSIHLFCARVLLLGERPKRNSASSWLEIAGRVRAAFDLGIEGFAASRKQDRSSYFCWFLLRRL